MVGYVLDSDVVLYQPFVNCFRWVGHENTASKIRLCQHVWERCCVVDVETILDIRTAQWL